VEKELFCPLPCSTAGCVAIGHPICIVIMPHVMVIMRYNCQLYRIIMFIVIIAFCVWMVNVCQEAHVSLVPPHHSCQGTPGPYSIVTTFQSQCLGFEVLGHALSVWLHCPTTGDFFSGPSRQTGQGWKRSCPCTVYGQVLLPPFSD